MHFKYPNTLIRRKKKRKKDMWNIGLFMNSAVTDLSTYWKGYQMLMLDDKIKCI